MASKLPKGSKLSVVKTTSYGRSGGYDLYDLRGLTLGRLDLINKLLMLKAMDGNHMAAEIAAAIGEQCDEYQTVNGK